MSLLFYLNEHINQSVKEGDDYLMSNKVNKFILPDGTEVDLAGGGETINVDAELKEYMNVAKPAIASAIINKGGTVDDDDSLGDYATRISAIPNDVYPAETLPVQTGAHDIYKAGEYMIWTDGSVKKCVQDTNFSPTEYPQAWEDAS